MASVEDWQKYMNVLHELAWIEDDLRWWANSQATNEVKNVVKDILFERLGSYA